MNLRYLLLRLLRHFMPEGLSRLLLKRLWIIKPGLESTDPFSASQRYVETLSARGVSIAGKRVLVFGYGGQRDKARRPRMGKVASRFADRIIITTDNPRNEEPFQIASEVVSGIPDTFKNFMIVLDRYKAIKTAIDCATDNSIVLVAGKGHEPYQIFKDKKIEFDDRKVAMEILRARQWISA